MNERDLVLEFKRAKEERDRLREVLELAQKEYERAEFTLIEFLEAHQAVATAKYEGLGWVRIQKPRVYASCPEPQLEDLFAFLKRLGRTDLIKTTVMPQTLSSFTAECLEKGVEVPACVNYYLKPSVRLYQS